MSHVPKDTKWYLADLVEEIRIEGIRGNVVHVNTLLVRANSPHQAHREALAIGRESNTSYFNPAGKRVTIVFCGIHELQAIYERLRHGSELLFKEDADLSPSELKRLIKRKSDLDVFTPPRMRRRPELDYSSADVLRKVVQSLWRQAARDGKTKPKTSAKSRRRRAS